VAKIVGIVLSGQSQDNQNARRTGLTRWLRAYNPKGLRARWTVNMNSASYNNFGSELVVTANATTDGLVNRSVRLPLLSHSCSPEGRASGPLTFPVNNNENDSRLT